MIGSDAGAALALVLLAMFATDGLGFPMAFGV
jgi:hypothetical protein